MNKIVQVTSKGQVIIQKQIREKLGLVKGEEVLFELEGQKTPKNWFWKSLPVGT